MEDLLAFEIRGKLKRIFLDETKNTCFEVGIYEDQNHYFIHNVIIPFTPEADIIQGEKIFVTGSIRAYSYFDEEEKKTKNVVKLLADSVKSVKPILTERLGVKGRYYDPDYSKVFVVGRVKRVLQSADGSTWGNVVIGSFVNDKPNNIRIGYNTRKALPKIGNLDVGDRIAIYGTLVSSDKVFKTNKKKKVKVHFSNITTEDICIIEKVIPNIM